MDDLVSLLLDGRRHGSSPCFGFIPDGHRAAVDEVDFATFLDRALRIAGGMQDLGIGPGDRVALYAHPTVRYMTTMAATLLAGAVAAPINQHFRSRELSAYLSLVEPAAIFTDGSTDGLVGSVRPELVRISASPGAAGPGIVAIEQLEAGRAGTPVDAHSNDAAFIMHTSGTTGLPKGVVRTHGAYRRFVDLWAERFMAPGDSVLSFMPMYHQGGVMMSFLPAYRLGNPMYQLERFSVSTFWAAADQHDTRWAVFMPPVPSFLLLQPDLAPARSSLVWAMTGGRVDHWAEMQRRFDVVGHSGYGSTETTMVTMTGDRSSAPAGPAQLSGEHGGFACGGVIEGWGEVRVVGDDGAPAEVGQLGQLEFRGPGVFTEYYANPGATAAAFSEDGWFRPGDVGYLDSSGQLFMVDRSRDLIRRSGENIAPREIEDVLNDHPDVEEVAVVPVEDELRGQEIRACVVVRAGATVSPQALFEHCAEHLSPFKVPRFIELRRALPHTPTLKIKKDDLIAETDRAGWVDRIATAPGDVRSRQ